MVPPNRLALGEGLGMSYPLPFVYFSLQLL